MDQLQACPICEKEMTSEEGACPRCGLQVEAEESKASHITSKTAAEEWKVWTTIKKRRNTLFWSCSIIVMLWQLDYGPNPDTQRMIQQLNEDEYSRLQHEITVARTPYETTQALRSMDRFLERVRK